jgi:hypothetical protein
MTLIVRKLLMTLDHISSVVENFLPEPNRIFIRINFFVVLGMSSMRSCDRSLVSPRPIREF